jgi:hypothetical protein
MSVRLDDATAMLQALVAGALAALQVSLRADGVPAGGAGGDWATMELRWSGSVRSAPDERAAVQVRITTYLLVVQGALQRANAVGEALRGALVAQNLAVYGLISGTPGTLQGILQAVDFQHVPVGEFGSELITDTTMNLIERT